MKSAEIKQREGNQGHRRIEFGPEFSPIDPGRAPNGLSPNARKLWRELAPEFAQKRLLNVATAPLFVTLCILYGEMWEAQLEVQCARKESGDVDKAVTQLVKMSNSFRTVAAKFGMSPADRERVSLPGQPQPSRGRKRDEPELVGRSGDPRPSLWENFGDILA